MPMISARIRFVMAAAPIALLLAVAPFAATAGAQQRGRAVTPARELPRTPSEMGLHGYSVVLVIGGTQAAANSADATRDASQVPEAARKALADMQAFLPYKRYQLLDAAWMICCGMFRSPLSGRVRGPDNSEYAYTIETLHQADETKLTVRFSMRDATATSAAVSGARAGGSGGRGSSATGLSDVERVEYSRQLYEAIRERDEVESFLRTARAKYLETHPQMVEATARHQRAQARVEELQHLAGGGSAGGGRGGMVPNRTILDSTFSIALGETVVIGTSRLKGDQALIALLTAARKPGAAR